MPSPKDVLFKHGRIDKIGRGRISKENHAWLEAYVAKGGKVDGYSVSSKPESEPVVTKAQRVSEYGEVTLTHPEKDWEAWVRVDGKSYTVGMRTVCINCRNSLVGDRCGSPKVWVDFDTSALVEFKARVNPLPGKRW